ncbi:hypothetical protein SK128_017105 [Halocaridina rubra]|uniref:Uncharacterized protein n=1 Tax=Halocaridina rubra TaxID=373956 RepID=A0AAN8XK60_HALRR
MSSESEADEFYDACDITPHRHSTRGDELLSTNTPVNDTHVSTIELSPALSDVFVSQELPDKNLGNETEFSQLQTSSQPFLHPLKAFQLTKDQKSFEDSKIEVSPAGFEKEERRSLSGLSASRHDVEESSSACSGSLLGNLGDDDDEEAAPRVRSGGRRRTRHREVRKQMQREDDDPPFPPSPAGSQSSSLDGIYPERTSHPFRVVEHDTASVYSSVSLGKVGKILAGMEALTIREGSLEPATDGVPINKSPNQIQSIITKDISPENLSNSGGIVGITMSPEPDLVASTKSSSGSDKSNSLPRTAQESLPAVISSSVDSSLQLHIALSESSSSSPSQQLSHAGPGKDGCPVESSPSRLPGVVSSSTAVLTQPIDNHPLIIEQKVPLTVHSPAYASQEQSQFVSSSAQLPSSGPGIPSSVMMPVAPPRRRRKNRLNTDDDTSSLASVSSLPSPALTLGSVDAISIGQSLDLRQAIRGDYLVKPQDSENAKAVGPSAEEMARIEAEDTTSQASTPEVSRAPSRLANESNPPQSPSATPGTPGTPGSLPPETPTNDPLISSTSVRDGQMKQLNLMVRTRSDSGKELSDAMHHNHESS